MRNRCMFEKMAAGMALAAAVMAGAAMLPGSGHGLVINAYAADASNQNSQNISGGGTSTEDKIDKTDSAESDVETSGNSDDGSGIYDFKDNKTTGTVTITKKWDDGLTNAEREIPDMYLSTEKPSKSTKGYTVTFHGNGLKFADGTDENMVVYNSSGQIGEGDYKTPNWITGAWYSDEVCTQKVEISDDGVPQVELTGDLDLWAKEMTFEIKGYRYGAKNNNEFNAVIPDAVTEVIFTDEVKPKAKEAIDVDADGDGGVVAWLDNDAGTVMKVSTQIPGVKVQAAKDSGCMFDDRSKLQKIDFKMLDTQNVTDMSYMFSGCSHLTSLDLTPLDTQNVTDMSSMFYDCSGLTSLDLTPLNTQEVMDMGSMFCLCSGLTSLDLTPLNTQNVTDMGSMFSGCSGLTSLDLSSDTKNVTNMGNMFANCSGLTSLDLTPLDTKNVTDMSVMFYYCSGLTSLDLTPLKTQEVTDMGGMFYGCSGLTSLDLSPLDTQNVTIMWNMFRGCSGLTSLDLTPLDTQKVTRMDSMFFDCSGLTSLDLTPLDTSKVTNMEYMFCYCSGLTSLDLTPLDTSKVTNMNSMFSVCSDLTSLTTGTTFKFVGTDYELSGTWQNTAGETFTSGKFPFNVADTYTKISS